MYLDSIKLLYKIQDTTNNFAKYIEELALNVTLRLTRPLDIKKTYTALSGSVAFFLYLRDLLKACFTSCQTFTLFHEDTFLSKTTKYSNAHTAATISA